MPKSNVVFRGYALMTKEGKAWDDDGSPPIVNESMWFLEGLVRTGKGEYVAPIEIRVVKPRKVKKGKK